MTVGRKPVWEPWAERLGITIRQAKRMGEFECLRILRMSPEARDATLSLIRNAKKRGVGPYKVKFAHMEEE